MPKKKSSPNQFEFEFLDQELERLQSEIEHLHYGEFEEEECEEEEHIITPSPRLYLWSRLIDFCTRATVIALIICFCIAVAITSIPQLKKVRQMEKELTSLKTMESHFLDQREIKAIQIDSLRRDPAYLELRARDKIDYYHPGETIMRIHRPL